MSKKASVETVGSIIKGYKSIKSDFIKGYIVGLMNLELDNRQKEKKAG